MTGRERNLPAFLMGMVFALISLSEGVENTPKLNKYMYERLHGHLLFQFAFDDQYY
jgi:hypothetical protein